MRCKTSQPGRSGTIFSSLCSSLVCDSCSLPTLLKCRGSPLYQRRSGFDHIIVSSDWAIRNWRRNAIMTKATRFTGNMLGVMSNMMFGSFERVPSLRYDEEPTGSEQWPKKDGYMWRCAIVVPYVPSLRPSLESSLTLDEFQSRPIDFFFIGRVGREDRHKPGYALRKKVSDVFQSQVPDAKKVIVSTQVSSDQNALQGQVHGRLLTAFIHSASQVASHKNVRMVAWSLIPARDATSRAGQNCTVNFQRGANICS